MCFYAQPINAVATMAVEMVVDAAAVAALVTNADVDVTTIHVIVSEAVE